MIEIMITVIILSGLIYLLFVPVYLQIGYHIDRNSFVSGVIRLYPFTYRIRLKSGQDIGSGNQSEQKKQKTKKIIKISISHIQMMKYESVTLKKSAFNAIRFIHRIVITPDYHLNACLTGGFREPHVTGCFYGGVCAIQPMLGQSVDISYAPDFAEDSLYGKVTASLDVRLYGIIKEMLIFLWRLPKWRLLQIYLESRKGRAHGE